MTDREEEMRLAFLVISFMTVPMHCGDRGDEVGGRGPLYQRVCTQIQDVGMDGFLKDACMMCDYGGGVYVIDGGLGRNKHSCFAVWRMRNPRVKLAHVSSGYGDDLTFVTEEITLLHEREE